MIIWIISGTIAVSLFLTFIVCALLRGVKEHDQCLKEDQARAWAEYQAKYGQNTQTDEEWANKAAEKINNQVTQAELKALDEQRNPFRGYTSVEMGEGVVETAPIAKKERVEASAPQIQPGEIVNRIIWERDEQISRELRRLDDIQRFPDIAIGGGSSACGASTSAESLANLCTLGHSGPLNDPKMSIHARTYQHI